MAKRRASGEGNIRKRSDGRWEGRYVAGHDASGKPIRKNVLGKTQAEVKEKLKAALELSQRLDISKAEEYTVEKWVNVWFETYSKPNIREKTQEYYQRFIRLHIIPHIGHIKLNKLTSRDIQKMYNEVREHGRTRKEQKETNPGLSTSYVRGMHTMLHNCLDRAVKEKLIPYNPSDDCVLPKLKKQEMKILKQEDMAAYLAEADRRGVLPMMFMVLCTGLRRGEIAALRWDDLDIEKKTLSISKQAVAVKGGGVKATEPKTDTSIRKISVSQQVIDMLTAEHEKHPDNPIMFPSPVNGGMWYPDAINRLHQRILKSAGLEHIRLHDLRHTFATVALQNGVDVKTVSSMLGHSDAGFTLRTYTHVTTKMQEQAADTMGQFISQNML